MTSTQIGRGGLVAQLVAEALAGLGVAQRPLHVLDCGGGSGSFAVPLASSQCEVTVVDISADALATLRRRADDAGVAEFVYPLNGDVETLSSLLPSRSSARTSSRDTVPSFDAVLAHGILGVVSDVEATLRQMVSVLRPGGLLSLLVTNPDASVLARALAGEPIRALAELRALDDTRGVSPASIAPLFVESSDASSAAASAPSRTTLRPIDLERMCLQLGLVPHGRSHRHGIGVFSDLVPGAALNTPAAREAVRTLDIEASDRAPFAQLAARVHLMFRLAGGGS